MYDPFRSFQQTHVARAVNYRGIVIGELYLLKITMMDLQG